MFLNKFNDDDDDGDDDDDDDDDVKLYDNVLRWWFLCALERDCIAPTTNIHCDYSDQRQYGDCHRFDQSAINILLANYFAGDQKAYLVTVATQRVVRVKRSANRGNEQVAVCRTTAGSVVRTMHWNYL